MKIITCFLVNFVLHNVNFLNMAILIHGKIEFDETDKMIKSRFASRHAVFSIWFNR